MLVDHFEQAAAVAVVGLDVVQEAALLEFLLAAFAFFRLTVVGPVASAHAFLLRLEVAPHLLVPELQLLVDQLHLHFLELVGSRTREQFEQFDLAAPQLRQLRILGLSLQDGRTDTCCLLVLLVHLALDELQQLQRDRRDLDEVKHIDFRCFLLVCIVLDVLFVLLLDILEDSLLLTLEILEGVELFESVEVVRFEVGDVRVLAKVGKEHVYLVEILASVVDLVFEGEDFLLQIEQVAVECNQGRHLLLGEDEGDSVQPPELRLEGQRQLVRTHLV